MVRKALFFTLAVAVLAIVIALAVAFARQEYEATCALSYGHRVGGNVYYAFENDCNSTAYDQLVAMRESWLSPDFQSRIYKRVHAECANAPSNDMIKAISSAEVEIRAKRASVLVRVKASSQEIARACAKAFSREIVGATADQAHECKKRGVDQLKHNCEKQERYVISLREKLYQLKTGNTEESKLKEAEGRLVSQEEILAAMKADVVKLKADDSWCGFFVEMNDDGEVTNTQ